MSEQKPIAFFALPSNALKSLFDEIRVSVQPEVAEEIIYRYGSRCGEGVIEELDVKPNDLEEFVNMIDSLWSHVGLGRPKAKYISDTQFQVDITEAVEALAKGKSEDTSCAFSSGYLAGLTGKAMGCVYTVEETMCMAKGDDFCRHVLTIEDPGPPEDFEEEAVDKGDVAPTKHKLNKGYSYLVIDENHATAFSVFSDLLGDGFEGFCVTRTFPDKIKDTYGFETPMLWLTMEEGEMTLVPHNVAKLNFIIEQFIKKVDAPVVIIEGLEYLITHNTYETILRFLQLLNDKVALTNAILIIPVNPYTLDQKHLKLLEREMQKYDPKG